MTTLRTGQTTDYDSQDLTTKNKDDFFDIDPKNSDSPQLNETYWTPEWSKWNGYYRKIPELRSVINKFSSWTFGRGIEAEPKNKAKLKKIKGNGKESPRVVLKNQWKVALICGDSFAEIIKDLQGRLTNLKPLNPGTIRIIYNEFGVITRYEQWQGNKGSEKRTNSWDKNDIFHLSYERTGDEIHGIPFPEAMIFLIKSRNQSMEDLDVLYHRNIKPIQFFEVETDDQTKLNAVENTINDAYKKSENVVIPAGVIKEIKRSSVPQYGNLDSLNYVKFIVRQFVTSCGMPEIVMGWGAETTEASASIIYLAYQQEIEDMQLYIQEMVELQLNIEINLEFPASLENKLKANKNKRGKGTTTEPGKDG